MRAFLIPHASPHNSHANRISRPRREIKERTACGKEYSVEIIIGGQLLHITRGSCVAASRSSAPGCFAATSLPQSNTARERVCPRAIISRSARAPRVPRSDRKKDPAPPPPSGVIACSRLPRKYRGVLAVL